MLLFLHVISTPAELSACTHCWGAAGVAFETEQKHENKWLTKVEQNKSKRYKNSIYQLSSTWRCLRCYWCQLLKDFAATFISVFAPRPPPAGLILQPPQQPFSNTHTHVHAHLTPPPHSPAALLLSLQFFEGAECSAPQHIRCRIKLFIELGCYHLAH